MKKRVVAILMTTVLAVSMLVGCGGKKTGGDGKDHTSSNKDKIDVEIGFWYAGLGIEWLDALIDAFEEKHPEYNVFYNSSADSAAVRAAFGMPDTDTTDLYMVGKLFDIANLEPLNDVLETTVEGESKTIGEKFNPSYLELEKCSDGNYYALSRGGGVYGIVYNKKLFDKTGITQLPRTTDELLLDCGMLKDEGITPIVHFTPSGYYSCINLAWYAQYEGIDYFLDIYQNPTLEKFTKKDGRYEVLKLHEKLNTPENVLSGSNSSTHITMQTKFLEGEAAMMVSGSWLASEMNYSDKMDDFAMMKTPVISSTTDKLTTVKSEQELRKLISAIDNVTDGVESEDTYKDGDDYKVEDKSISAADWDYVRTARNLMNTSYAADSCYIPKYSDSKEGAKEFLKFMYSDEGYKIYSKTSHLTLPLSLDKGEIDTSSWSSFEKNQWDLLSKATIIAEEMMSKNRLYTDGGANIFPYSYEFIPLMCSNNEADRVNADQAWDAIVATINDRYERDWMANIK